MTGGRQRETDNGRDSSDVADNEPRRTTEAMHRKEGPNTASLLITNDRDAQTEKKTTNVANLQRQRGCKITTQTQTQREVSSKTRKRVRTGTDSVSNHYGDKGQVGNMYGKR